MCLVDVTYCTLRGMAQVARNVSVVGLHVGMTCFFVAAICRDCSWYVLDEIHTPWIATRATPLVTARSWSLGLRLSKKDAMSTEDNYSCSGTVGTSSISSCIVRLALESVEADSAFFQLYSGGVMRLWCGTNLDHAVLAVSYGSDGSMERCTTESHLRALVLKSSRVVWTSSTPPSAGFSPCWFSSLVRVRKRTPFTAERDMVEHVGIGSPHQSGP